MTRPERVVPPPVSATQRGQVSNQLDLIAEAYREHHPGRDCRYVYDPQHVQKLMKVMTRKAQGYKDVVGADLGDSFDFDDSEIVRIGDLRLMSIEIEMREQLIREKELMAKEELKRVEPDFASAMENVEATSASGEVHKSKAVGRADVREVEREVLIEQRTEEET